MNALDPLNLYMPTAVARGPVGQRRIDLLYTARSHLWHLHYTEGAGWSQGWLQRGGAYKSSVAACAFSGGRIDTFGLGADGDLHHAWAVGAQLDSAGEWPVESVGHPPGRTIVSAPAAIMTSPTNLIVAVRTTRDSNNAPGIWFVESESTLTGLKWGSWTPHLVGTWPSVKAGFASGLGMTWRKPGSYDLAVIGDDSYLRHSVSDDNNWETFMRPGEGYVTSTPSLTYWHEPALSSVHVAFRHGGPSTPEDGAVVLKSWLGRDWNEAHQIYRAERVWSLGPPTITSWGKPRLDVFFLYAAYSPDSRVLGIMHGISEKPPIFNWDEVLPAPPLD